LRYFQAFASDLLKIRAGLLLFLNKLLKAGENVNKLIHNLLKSKNHKILGKKLKVLGKNRGCFTPKKKQNFKNTKKKEKYEYY